ncbi:RNA polymerase sigma factor [Gudongella oleilytica]|uniref:RNA polymerase sigma factor n=1 Tax=Gudongella oleilytica TaxID=1582259 RepID=UPI0013E8B3F9|nr:sigma-70 family RNA polymerase sigma factor [Gudongella oleilytica]
MNISRDRLRKSEDLLPLEEELIVGDDLESKIVVEIDREILRTSLYKLSLVYREVLVLYYFKDFSIKEISEILGDSEGTIKSRLSRGRKLLGESY